MTLKRKHNQEIEAFSALVVDPTSAASVLFSCRESSCRGMILGASEFLRRVCVCVATIPIICGSIVRMFNSYIVVCRSVLRNPVPCTDGLLTPATFTFMFG